MTGSMLAEPAEVGSTDILFVGSQFDFPDLILRLIKSEFAGAIVERWDSLERETPHPASKGLRLVILEEGFAPGLEDRLGRIRAGFPGVPLVLAYRNPDTARAVLARQQADRRLEGLRFLPINAPIAGLMSMLQLLLAGEFVVPGELLSANSVREKAGESAPEPRPCAIGADILTPREMQVLELVARGAPNKAIAAALSLSEHTVKLHLHNIITKINVGNRTEAASWYIGQGRGEDLSRMAK